MTSFSSGNIGKIEKRIAMIWESALFRKKMQLKTKDNVGGTPKKQTINGPAADS